jgi:hypothetical protein
VMVLNRGATNVTVTLAMEDVGDSMSDNYAIRDLWQHRNLSLGKAVVRFGTRSRLGTQNRFDQQRRTGTQSRSVAGLDLVVAPHGVRMLRLWPIAPPPPSPPPPPPQCPEGFVSHEAGFWANTDPCPQSAGPGCTTRDHDNATVVACGAKCLKTAGCVAFEVFMIDIPPADRACYIFLRELQPPFVPDVNSFACVVKASASHTFAKTR